MDNESIEINKKYFVYPIVMFIVGLILFLFLPHPKSSKTKEYPITVQCYWETNGLQSWPSMDVDSVKGDTIWKDGLSIVNKNITNIQFK